MYPMALVTIALIYTLLNWRRRFGAGFI